MWGWEREVEVDVAAESEEEAQVAEEKEVLRRMVEMIMRCQ